MPRDQMKLTLISSLLLALWPLGVRAAGEAPPESGPPQNIEAAAVAAQDKGAYITVEETIGATAPLRQTRRLDVSRFKADPTPEIPAVAEAVLPKAVAEPVAEVKPSAAVAGVPVDTSLPKVSQGAADAAGRIIEMLQRGMLTPELAADLLAKLATVAIEPTTKPASFVQSNITPPNAATPLLPPPAPVAVLETPPAASSVAGVEAQAAALPPISGVPEAKASPIVPEWVPNEGAGTFAPVQVAMADTSNLVLAQASVTPVVAESAPSAPEPKGWSLARDDRTVRSSFERWTRDANWQLAWEYPVDFQIEFDANFEGDFADAVAKVIDGIASPDRPVRAEFYYGNRVLRIVSGRGE